MDNTLDVTSNVNILLQIRKMMAVILGVSTGRLETAVVKDMLDQSVKVQLRDTDIYQIPPHALYLTDVQYDEEGTGLTRFHK